MLITQYWGLKQTGGACCPALLSEALMDEVIIEVIKKMTDKFERFLKACKADGDKTIDDALRRLEGLKKKT